jgi:cyclophilin family peptidyl-prolyl cis-trans isomerase
MRALAAAGLALAGALSANGQTAPQGGWRDVDPENILVIETSKGRVIAELMPQVAPKTVERIKTLARQGLYDNRAFFRVIDDFMAQTGDPTDTGQGASALPDIEGEFSFRRGRELPFLMVPNAKGGNVGFIGALPVRTEPDAQMAITADGKVRANGLHCKGVLGMARSDDPNSGNSQFYLMRQKADALNGRYTAFGRVLQGLDVVRAIKPGDPQSGQVTEPRDTMTRVRVLADLPAESRPKVRVQATTSPEFSAYVASQTKTKGATIDICELDIPVSVQ